MNISLEKKFEQRVNEQVAAGLYTSASEMIQNGLALLFEQEAEKQRQLERLKLEVGKGVAQLDAGDKARVSVMDIFEQAKQDAQTVL